MKSSQRTAHLERYEPTQSQIRMHKIATPTMQQTEQLAPVEPTIDSKLRFVKAQNHLQASTARVTEKWLSAEAKDAFCVAAKYVGQLVVMQQPQPYEIFEPQRSASFYQAMAIGVRTYLHADAAATGVE